MKRRAPFAALLSACVISVAGTSMSAIAIPWLVLTTTGSAARTGLVAFAEMAPYVLAQALAGPLVDRAGLRRCFVWGNLTAAIAVGTVPLMYVLGQLSLPGLLALVAIGGAVRGTADCANSALIPSTAEVGGIALERAAGLNAAANRTALLLGAPLAGLLITLAGSPTAVAIDAGTFAVAAAIGAVWVRVPEPAVPGRVPVPAPRTPPDDALDADAPVSALRRYGRDLATGLRFVRGDRLLMGLILMIAVTNLLDQGMAAVMLPVWVRHEIGSAGALGLIGGLGGLGAVVGNMVGAWLGPRLSRRALYSVGFLVGGAPRFFVLVFSGTLAPVVVVTLVAEMFAGSLNSVIGATVYERIPEALRARVLGVFRASTWVGIPFGALFAGYTVEGFGVTAALSMFGVAYLVTTLAPFVFPAWRQMERRRPDRAAADRPPVVRVEDRNVPPEDEESACRSV